MESRPTSSGDSSEGSIPADTRQRWEDQAVNVGKDAETIHYSEIRCVEDELARVWALYPRDEE